VNRRNFQNLARTRAAEAEYLLAGGHYAGAYYLTGYVVECALKACVAKQVKRYDFPDKQRVNESYTHDLTKLLSLSGLVSRLNTDRSADALLERSWNIAKNWSEQSRYELHTRIEAEELFRAVMNSRYGVFPWLRRLW
jgi:HEPN domain-containing protein